MKRYGHNSPQSPDQLPSGIVTLITDFGTADGYAGAMKGAILSVNPLLRVVDITHDVRPQDIRGAAGVLARSAPWFPGGTVHLVVVDPGVGSSRKALVARVGRQLLVGPDNGFLTRLSEREGLVTCSEIDVEGLGVKNPSATFHGRDVFARAAGLLATGSMIPEQMGRPLVPVMFAPVEGRCLKSGEIEGSVVSVDRFGNIITDITRFDAGDGVLLFVRCCGRAIDKHVHYYAEANEGELVFLWGSDNQLEIACVNGSASSLLKVAPGERVTVGMS